ncbi:hypothetical protein L873DRAFT_1725155, partial [Choiromyces venosus 120613-1]
FNFIKIHYLSHFASHVWRFGSISMYSTEISELAHKEQIKDGYQRSNKNKAARQILSQSGYWQTLGMRLGTIEVLSNPEGVTVVGNSRMGMQTSPGGSAPQQVLKGRTKISTLPDLCRAIQIDYRDMMEEILRFIRQTPADDLRLPTNSSELELLPIE